MLHYEPTGFAVSGRELTPLAGRTVELAMVAEQLARAAAGRGQVIALVGEAGAGKSRLVYEVTSGERARAFRLLRASAVSHRAAMPFAVVSELLHHVFGVDDGDAPARIHERVVAALGAMHPDLASDVPALLALLDVEDPRWQAVDPQRRRPWAIDAVRRLLLAESRRAPLLLVVEDLHWLDPHSHAVLDSIVDALGAAPCALLVTYRPESQHRWAGKTYYTQVRVDALSPAQSHEVLRWLVGDDPSVDAIKRVLIERTGGDALFLEENVRALVEMGALVGRRSAYRAGPTVDSADVPPTVHAVLASRIGRLPPPDREVLEIAAVIGKDVPLGVLEAVAHVAPETLRDSLRRLTAGELLYETRVSGEAACTFKHALTHDVAYGNVSADRRRRLHARIVDALERRHADRVGDHVELLAHHALAAEAWSKAATYLRRAAVRALRRSALAEAKAAVDRGLAVVADLPDSAARIEQELDLQLLLAQVVGASHGQAADAVGQAYARARLLSERIGGTSKLLMARWGLWSFALLGARLADAREEAEQLIALADATDHPTARRAGREALGISLLVSGEFRLALAELERGRALYRPPSSGGRTVRIHEPAVGCEAFAGYARWLLGYPDDATRRLDTLRALVREVEHPYDVAFAEYYEAYLHYHRRDLPATRAAAERAVAVASQHGIAAWLAMATIQLGWALVAAGDHDAGLGEMRAGLDAWRASGAELFLRPTSLALLGHALLLAGRAADACEALDEALSVLDKTGERWWEAETYRLRGESLLRLAPREPAAAVANFRRAAEVAGRQGARSFELRAAVSLARVLSGRRGSRALLAHVYEAFTEGFDTVDLTEARATLEALAP